MWKMVKLGDVCKITNGSTPLRKEKRYWAEGNIPWFTIDDLRVQGKNITHTKQNVTQAAVDEKRVRLVPANSVLLCCTASIGAAAIARVEMATNQQFNALTPKSAAINSDYLYFVATTLTQTLLSVSGSTTINFVSMSKLREISIPLPPIAEQERIVAKLDATFAEIDEAVNAVESKESEVQALKTSILNKLLNNKSNGWESSCLEGVSSFISRGISPKYIESGGVRVLNQKCIRNHHINYDLARRHDMDLKKVSEERFIKLGDILINSTGKGTLGRVAQVRKEPDELTTIDSHITIVRPKSELFYLDYFGYAAVAIEKIIQDAGQGASGQTELAKSKVQNDFQICFPRSFSEQEVEVKKLDIVFEKTEIALTNLIKSKTNLYALKSVILSVELKPNEAA